MEQPWVAKCPLSDCLFRVRVRGDREYPAVRYVYVFHRITDSKAAAVGAGRSRTVKVCDFSPGWVLAGEARMGARPGVKLLERTRGRLRRDRSEPGVEGFRDR
jgi:hypothetical protein